MVLHAIAAKANNGVVNNKATVVGLKVVTSVAATVSSRNRTAVANSSHTDNKIATKRDLKAAVATGSSRASSSLQEAAQISLALSSSVTLVRWTIRVRKNCLTLWA